MRPNILYNYLQKKKAEGFVRSTTRENKEYFRFELEEQLIQIMGYRLTSHHISIYEKIDNSKSDLSPYHYTGYLKDAEENQYRIHVNFNYNRQVIAVVFSKQVGDTYTAIEAEHLHELFVELAQQNCEPVISKVRDDLSRTVADYINDYKELTKVAEKLSEHIEENFEKYVISLEKICDKLNSLMPITEDGHYRSLYSVTQRLQKAVASQYNAPKPVPKDDEEPQEEQLLSESHVDSTPRKTQPDHLDKEISSLVCEFQSLSVEDEPCAKGLANIFSRINEYSLLLEDHNYTATVSNYKALCNLIHEHQQAVIKLLYKLFLTKKLELTQHLSFSFTTPAFQTLLSKTLELALHRKDYKLLDFHLTHGNFSVSKPLTVAGVEYASIMDYCEKNNPETDSIDCVIVLIKHKAFLKCDDSGMPMAYAIMSAATHPFKMAFNKLHPVERAALYCELVPALKSYLLRHPNDPQKDTIESNIQTYETLSKMDSSHQSRIAYGRMTESNGAFESIRKSEALETLANDAEIIKLHDDLRVRCVNFKGPEKIQRFFTTLLNWVNLNAYQPDLDSALVGLEKVSASTLKENAIGLLGKVNELFDCLETLMAFDSSSHKVNTKGMKNKANRMKNLQALQARIDSLIKELKIGKEPITAGGVLNLMQTPTSVVPLSASEASDSKVLNSAHLRTSNAVFFPATPEPKDQSTASPDKEEKPRQTYKGRP